MELAKKQEEGTIMNVGDRVIIRAIVEEPSFIYPKDFTLLKYAYVVSKGGEGEWVYANFESIKDVQALRRVEFQKANVVIEESGFGQEDINFKQTTVPDSGGVSVIITCINESEETVPQPDGISYLSFPSENGETKERMKIIKFE